MQLDDLIEYLALGTIGNSKLFEEKPRNPNALYEITRKNRAALIGYINDATMAISLRLPLFWYSTVIRLVEGKNTYVLDKKHSILNMPDGMYPPEEPLIYGSEEAYYYIYDSVDFPFENNVLLMGAITSESGLYDMTLANETNTSADANGNAVYTPRPNVIEVPEDMIENDEYLTIKYLGSIPRIPLSTEAGADYDVPVPDTLLEAVSAYICHKLQLPPQSPENASVGISYIERFNSICDEHIQRNISNMFGDSGLTTFKQRGWV